MEEEQRIGDLYSDLSFKPVGVSDACADSALIRAFVMSGIASLCLLDIWETGLSSPREDFGSL